jgi:C4-dicarboxylate-specific signal transduction histidine kinase
VESEKTRSGADYDPLNSLAHELGERVKELNCLFGISDIVERANGSLEYILRETAELLTVSWDHADVACARILLGEEEYRSESYGEVVDTQAAVVQVHGKDAGTIEVSYKEQRPPRMEGPFTKDERRLLDAVAERIGHVIERLDAEAYIREKEEQFRQRMTHLTRVNTMGEMASSIAHEVSQPLTAVATYAQACRRLVASGMVEAPEVLDVLGRIGDEALRAGDIIRRLRNLVQRSPARLELCDLPALVREVEPLAAVDARLNDIKLVMRFPRRAPPVQADGIQIQQVVLNLIRNAVDAMKDQPTGRRVLEVRVGSESGGEVQVSVSDRGCGLPDVDDEQLFEPFFTTKPTGLGLGLSISRSIVAIHGGRLWYSRNPDGGTTFFFALPKADKNQDE